MVFRVKQSENPFMSNIKNNAVPVIRPTQAGFGSMAAEVKIMPMRDVFKNQAKLMSAATDYSTRRQTVPCVRLGINILRTAPVDGLNQQAPQGIARHQLPGMQYNLQEISHPLNGPIMPRASNFNAALNSNLGMVK